MQSALPSPISGVMLTHQEMLHIVFWTGSHPYPELHSMRPKSLLLSTGNLVSAGTELRFRVDHTDSARPVANQANPKGPSPMTT